MEKIKCPYCGKDFLKLSSTHIKTHNKTMEDLKREFPECKLVSPEIQEKIEKTNLEKYGVKNQFQSNEIKEKTKKTCLKKYGVEYSAQSSEVKDKIKETNLIRFGDTCSARADSVKEKIKKTNLDRFGCECSLGNDKVREKAKETFIRKYGYDNPGKSPEIKEKIILKNIERYGVDSPNKVDKVKEKKKKTYLKKYDVEHSLKSPIVRNKIYNTKKEKLITEIDKFIEYIELELIDGPYDHSKVEHLWKCKKCNNEFKKSWNLIQQGFVCTVCNPREIGVSKAEVEIREFINKYYNILPNDRSIIYPYELDVVIPSLKTAIEFCGIYWHSDKYADKMYHLNKLNLCKDLGYNLITIFEDEWVLKKDIVISRLKSILNIEEGINKIHARKCTIKEIDSTVKNIFLDENHIQGKDFSNVNLGAFYNDELVSIMTFSKSNLAKGFKREEGTWELSRFCTKVDYKINGIASKLLSFFKKNYEWNEIFSFADKRWSRGNLYYILGFEELYHTKPNYWYVKGLSRIHRFNLRKKENDPKDIPEYIIRAKEGYRRIFDCGNIKFLMKK